jgi:branched-chain amino acid transport system substrate-binding protein
VKTKLILGLMVLLSLFSMFAGCSTSNSIGEPVKTIKIGVVAWLGFPIGLDMKNGIDVMVEQDNAAGGLLIGKERYKVELIVYDSNNSQTQEVAAVNKLIFQDKVKYILASEEYVAGWIDIAESNKVLSFGPQVSDVQLDPKYKYSFNPNFNRSGNSILIGWFCKKHPDLAKDIVYAYPDSQMGHAGATADARVFEAFGAKFTPIFYPANSTDLSSLGTKVRELNPSAFGAAGAGPGDVMAVKAAYDAGYKGQIFMDSGASAAAYVALAQKQTVEGLLMGAGPCELTPQPTKVAEAFRAAWIAKFGSWTGPELMGTGSYSCLRAALQETGSLDPDVLAKHIADGMKYEGPTGIGQMISRPDLGNAGTVDAVTETYVKTIKDGEPILVDTIPIDVAAQYQRLAFPAK